MHRGGIITCRAWDLVGFLIRKVNVTRLKIPELVAHAADNAFAGLEALWAKELGVLRRIHILLQAGRACLSHRCPNLTALLSLAVMAVLLLGRSGRSAAVSVRAAAVPVLPLVFVLAVLFLSAGGLSGRRKVLRRGWLGGAALPGGLWVEGGGTYRCVWQRAMVSRPRPMPRRRVVAPQAPPSPLTGTRARRGLRG